MSNNYLEDENLKNLICAENEYEIIEYINFSGENIKNNDLILIRDFRLDNKSRESKSLDIVEISDAFVKLCKENKKKNHYLELIICDKISRQRDIYYYCPNKKLYYDVHFKEAIFKDKNSYTCSNKGNVVGRVNVERKTLTLDNFINILRESGYQTYFKYKVSLETGYNGYFTDDIILYISSSGQVIVGKDDSTEYEYDKIRDNKILEVHMVPNTIL